MPTLLTLNGEDLLDLLKRTPSWELRPTASSYRLTCGETETSFPLDMDGLNAALRALLASAAAVQTAERPHAGRIEP